MSALTTEMKQKLSQYAMGQSSLEEFENWFAPVHGRARSANDGDAEALALAVEWAFCDFERGLSSPELLKKNLGVLALPGNTTQVGKPFLVGGMDYNPASSDGTSSKLQAGAAWTKLKK